MEKNFVGLRLFRYFFGGSEGLSTDRRLVGVSV